MGCTLVRAEVALLLSMARAANGCAQATLRYGRSVGSDAFGSPGRAYQLDQPGLEQSALDGYCAYLRELAGVARVSAITFVEELESLRRAAKGPRPEAVEISQAPVVSADVEAVRLRERADPARRSAPKGAASKEFLLY
jgi:hypothetical protein